MRRKVMLPLILLLILVATFAGSVAFFSMFSEGSTENKIEVGELTFKYTEIDENGRGIYLDDAAPMSTEEGKELTEYFDFKVEGKLTRSDIVYEIELDTTENELPTNGIRVYLTEIKNGEEVEINNVVNTLSNYETSENGKIIYRETILRNTKNYEKNFRLRIWLDDSVDWNEYVDSVGEFTVNVNANSDTSMAAKDAVTDKTTTIERIVANDRYLFTSSSDNQVDYEVTVPSTINTAEIVVYESNTKATTEITKLNNLEGIRTQENAGNLRTGNNYFKAVVTSSNGQNNEEYILKVVREPSTNNNLLNLGIEGYSLSPSFDKDILEYSVTLEESSINIVGEAGSNAATISGLGEKNLVFGDNTFNIVVTPEDPNAAPKTYTIHVNNVRPETPYIYGGSDNWYSDATICIDDYYPEPFAISGVAYYEVYVSTNDTLPTDSTVATDITDNEYEITSDGIRYVYYRTVSNKGLKSEWSNPEIVKIDNSVPGNVVIAASDLKESGTWHGDDFTLNLSATKNGPSDVYIYYGVTEDTEEEGNSILVNINSLTTSGLTYYAVACNDAGNCSDVVSYVAKLDKTTPSNVTLLADDSIGSGTWHTNNFALNLSGVKVGKSNLVYYLGTSEIPTTVASTVSLNTNSSTTSGTTYYGKVCNEAGNCSDIVNYVAKLDKSTPTATLSASDGITSGNWHSANYTLSLTNQTAISGVTYYLDTNSDPTTTGQSVSISSNTSGTTYYGKVCTGAGNCSTVSSYVDKLDKTAPTATLTASDGITSGNWHIADYTLSLTNQTAISGVTYYLDTNGDPTTAGQSVSISSNTSGTTYYGKVCTGAGICSTVSSYVAKLDKNTVTAPVITGGTGTSWASSARTITISTAGSSYSGVARYEYYKTTSTTAPTADTTATANLTTSPYSLSVSDEGTTYIYYRTVSNSGKKSAWSSVQQVNIDTKAPTNLSISSSDGIGSGSWHGANFNLNFSATKNGASNITYYHGSDLNNATTGASASISTNSTTTSGTTYYMKACNAAGVCSTTNASYVIKLDKQAPTAVTLTASDSKASGTWHGENFTISVSATKNGASDLTYYYGTTESPSTSGSSISVSTNSTTTSGTTYYAKACNQANVCSTTNGSYVAKLDKSAPTGLTITSSDGITSGDAHSDGFTLTFSATKGGASDITYYHGSNLNNATTGTTASFIDTDDGTTYYVKACNAAGICSSAESYIITFEICDFLYENYVSTGAAQTFTAPCTSRYKIELWGAGGGTGTSGNNCGTTVQGKRGAYTSGIIELTEGENILLYIGGAGNNNTTSASVSGGWNGGGAGTRDVNGGSCAGGSGGGASDVRLVSGSAGNADSLKSRIMVAAGGSGARNNGYGAGLSNENSSSSLLTNQTKGRAFGTATTSGTAPKGGNGGGYWMGYLSTNTSTGGSGSTSFISGHTGCVAIASSSSTSARTGTGGASCTTGTTDNLCSIHYSGKYFVDTKMVDAQGYSWTNVKASEAGTLPEVPSGTKYKGRARITRLEKVKTAGLYNSSGVMTHTWAQLEALGLNKETIEADYYSSAAGSPGSLFGANGLSGNLVLPVGITRIGYSAFKDATGLTGITLPNSLETIAAAAFENCTNLTSVKFVDAQRASVISVFNCTGVATMQFGETVSISDCNVLGGSKETKKWRAYSSSSTAFGGGTGGIAITYLYVDNAALNAENLTTTYVDRSWTYEGYDNSSSEGGLHID